ADRDDAAAREILFTAALQLSTLTLSVVRRLDLCDSDVALVKCGGVFGHNSMLDVTFDSLLASGIPKARVSLLQASSAMGAAKLAIRFAQQEQPIASRAHL